MREGGGQHPQLLPRVVQRRIAAQRAYSVAASLAQPVIAQPHGCDFVSDFSDGSVDPPYPRQPAA